MGRCLRESKNHPGGGFYMRPAFLSVAKAPFLLMVFIARVVSVRRMCFLSSGM